MQEQEEEEEEEEIERERKEGFFFQRYYKFSECSCYAERHYIFDHATRFVFLSVCVSVCLSSGM